MTILERAAQATTDALGSAIAFLPAVPVGERWALVRLTAQSPAVNAYGTLRVYKGGPAGSFLDGTSSAQSDVSDSIAGVDLYAGEQVCLVWSECSPSTPFTALASFDVKR